LIVGQRGIDVRCGVKIAVEAAAKVLLAGEVGAIANPHGEVGRAELAADLDAFDVVLDRLRPDLGVGRGQRSAGVAVRLAGLVLEGVRIDRIEAEPETGGFLAQGGVVAHLVPGEVRRDARGLAAELVDHRAVFQLFVHIGRLAGDRELGEARTPAPCAP
jgi:hypothetical protein